MNRLRASLLLLVFSGCEERKPPAAPSPPPPAAESLSFAEVRRKFLDGLADFEAHAWDVEGKERRKAVVMLADAGEKLSACRGRREDLPEKVLRRATRRVATEASAFSQKMNIQESIGKPLDQGLPWPYEYNDAAALVRCLLTDAKWGTTNKRQSFGRFAALVGVIEVLSEDAPIAEVRASLTELFAVGSRLFADHKDLAHSELELVNSLLTSRFQDGKLSAPQLRTFRRKLVELAKGD